MGLLTTTIGAYPKPAYVKLPDWFDNLDTAEPTRGWYAAREAMGEEAESIIRRGTHEAVNDQVNAGIDIPTDGEIARENYIHYHCRHLDGIDFNKLTKKVARTGNYECWLPTVTDTVKAKEPFLVKEWQLAQKMSSKPVKITIPGPMTITDTISNEFYDSPKKMGEDLAEAIKVEINRLADAGCKYIQIDEPLFARKPKEAIEYGIKNLEKCFEEIINKKIEKITHICCGYPDKLDAVDYPKAPLNSYHEIAEILDNSIVDSISIEDAHRYNDLNLLNKYKNKKIIFGVLKIASSKIDSEEDIYNRVKEALSHIDKERLILAPDCGLGHLPRELSKKN